MPGLTIGKAAKAAEINIETIRYYERQGLIQQPASGKEGGYRKYGDETVKRLIFIKIAKNLGFSLKEIKDLLILKSQPKAKGSAVKAKVDLKIEQIDQRIADLQAIKATLQNLNSKCSGDMSVSECPILKGLSQQELPSHCIQ